VFCAAASTCAHGPSVQFERVFPLERAEGVFAYARISPDGGFLAYASESVNRRQPADIERVVTVVDLRAKAVQFAEPGIDAYWSNDGRRLIFMSTRNGRFDVSIRNAMTGVVARDVAPPWLGDYFSWGIRDGRDVILTIDGYYYFLNGDKADLPAQSVKPCEGIGTGERPLLSKDGRRITTFVHGTIVIRNLTDCDDILDTGIRGAKADFSWDGRYVAFHGPKPTAKGYDIHVVDVQRRTVRKLAGLSGSSLFPNWTRDGRLCFRYDGDDYRGFMIAENVLTAAESPLHNAPVHTPSSVTWSDVFPETVRPSHRFNLVTIWSPWSAHSPTALAELQRAVNEFRSRGLDVAVATAAEPGSDVRDVDQFRRRYEVSLPRIWLAPRYLALTDADNQIPTTLLFRDAVLVDRRLGAQSYDRLRQWLASASSTSLN
jgi:WD40 repeat protein